MTSSDAGMQIRASPAAEVAATLDELDAKPGLGQRAGRAHAGHAAAYDDCGFWDRHLSWAWQHWTHDSGYSLHIFLSSPM